MIHCRMRAHRRKRGKSHIDVKLEKCVCGETKTVIKYDANGTFWEVCVNCDRVRRKITWG